jgi:hypothetical protein
MDNLSQLSAGESRIFVKSQWDLGGFARKTSKILIFEIMLNISHDSGAQRSDIE